MKKQPLTGSVKDGMFKPQNPYRPQSVKYNEFVALHPELPILTSTNTPVKDTEKVEAVLVWQVSADMKQWHTVSEIDYPGYDNYDKRQVYILLTEAPKESEGCAYEEEMSAPLSDKSDVEERKTAQAHLDEAANNCGYIDFQTMLSLEEERVIEPIVLSRMELYATDQEKLMQGEIDINWRDVLKNTPKIPNRKMLVKTAGRHSDYIFGYLSIMGWSNFETEEPINVTHFAEINSPYKK